MDPVLGLFAYLAIAIVGATVVVVFVGLPCLVFAGWAIKKTCDFIEATGKKR